MAGSASNGLDRLIGVRVVENRKVVCRVDELCGYLVCALIVFREDKEPTII